MNFWERILYGITLLIVLLFSIIGCVLFVAVVLLAIITYPLWIIPHLITVDKNDIIGEDIWNR